MHAQAKTLEPLRIADTVTYGDCFALPAPGSYRIVLEIRVPGRAGAVRARFAPEELAALVVANGLDPDPGGAGERPDPERLCVHNRPLDSVLGCGF